MSATIYTFDDLPIDRPMPKIERRRIVGEKMMVQEVHLAKGFTLPSHSHANEQMVITLTGRCRFGLGVEGSKEYREVEVRGGQVLVLPGNVPHSCVALEETHIIDMFSPPSQMTGVDRR